MLKHTLQLGALGALCLLPYAAQAHECRALGLANAQGSYDAKHPENSKPVPDQYWICPGFSGEDPAHGIPGAGKPNNLDFFPFYIPGKDFNKLSSLDTAKGDKVDITATLYYLNDYVFDVPYMCVFP
jgi:hypothetical protein